MPAVRRDSSSGRTERSGGPISSTSGRNGFAPSAPAVAALSAPPFLLSAGRATVLRTTRLIPELRQHPVSSTARTDSFNTDTREDEDPAQSGSLGSSARSPDVTMTHDQKRARLETLLRENDLSLARVSVAIGRNKTYLQQYLRRGMPAVLGATKYSTHSPRFFDLRIFTKT